MSTIGGNNSIQDGLVFAYDTGNRLKSFKGEPTVNQITNQSYFSGGGATYSNGIWSMTVLADNVAAWRGFSYTSTDAISSPGDVCYHSFEAKSGGNYTVPIHWDINNYGITTDTGSNDNDKNRVYNAGDAVNYEWRRFHVKYEFDSALTQNFRKNNRIIMANGHAPGIDKTLLVRNIQEEVGPNLTPFTPNTRTATDSLLDLTKNTTIDVTNTSFDSSGLIFDRPTNNKINTFFGNGIDPSITPFTIEAWVKANAIIANPMWISTTGWGTNQRFYSNISTSTQRGSGIQGTTWANSSIADVNWHHQVLVMTGTEAQSYDNGVLVYSIPYTSYTLPSDLYFGSGNNTHSWDGQIPIARIYNKALTAQEVKRNFNSTKSRFGIT